MKRILLWAYFAADAATFVYLMADSWENLNWWNWIVLVPVNAFLATIWPIYWLILRPIFGG